VRWIAHNGAGYDPVDVHACKAKGKRLRWTSHIFLFSGTGIYLSNTPGAVNDATATTALYLLISTLRQYSIAERSLREHKWKPHGLNKRTFDVTGKTLGILGLGGIGTRLAILAHGFPMRVIYHSRHRNPDAPAFCEYFEKVEDMLAQTDVLSVHVPLRQETVGLVSEKWIRALKPGAIIINTARGKVIDEEAMIRALEDGHVSMVTMVRTTGANPENSSALSDWMSSPTSPMSTLVSLNFRRLPSCRIWEQKTKIPNARWKYEL